MTGVGRVVGVGGEGQRSSVFVYVFLKPVSKTDELGLQQQSPVSSRCSNEANGEAQRIVVNGDRKVGMGRNISTCKVQITFCFHFCCCCCRWTYKTNIIIPFRFLFNKSSKLLRENTAPYQEIHGSLLRHNSTQRE